MNIGLLKFLPKNLTNIILRNRILNNFSKLSVDEFLEALDRGIRVPYNLLETNDAIATSSKVLEKMVAIDLEACMYFKEEAFTVEATRQIVEKPTQIGPPGLDYLDKIITKYPNLLKNMPFLELAFSYLPASMLLPRLSKDQITPEIVSIVEKKGSPLTLTLENLKISELLMKSEILMKRVINNSDNPNLILEIPESYLTEGLVLEALKKRFLNDNPNLILEIPESCLTEKLALEALKKGFIPTKQLFIERPYLKEFKCLLDKAFEEDSSVIMYYKNITPELVEAFSAHKNKYVFNLDELNANPLLCGITSIMEDSISIDPKAIFMVSKECYIHSEIIIQTLAKLTITKEDLKKHPNFATNRIIMSYLTETNPAFKLYSPDLTSGEKFEAIIEYLKSSQSLSLSIDELPFLDKIYNFPLDISNLNELLALISLTINEKSENEQQKQLALLDKLVDGIVNIRYIKNRNFSRFPNIVEMEKELNLQFKFANADKIDEDTYLNQLADDFYDFANAPYFNNIDFLRAEQNQAQIESSLLSKATIYSKIREFYAKYTGKSLTLENTAEFFNELLNKREALFVSIEKRKIFTQLQSKLKLSEKKKEAILIGRKIGIINRIISSGFHYRPWFYVNPQNNIKEEEIDESIEAIKDSIKNNSDLKKAGVIIDDDKFKELVRLFKRDSILHISDIKKILSSFNISEEACKFIAKKFEQIKLKFIDRIALSREDRQISTSNIGINHNNYVIEDRDRYLKNIVELIINLDQETLDKILANKQLLKEISWIIPFVGLFEELTLETLINTLANYDRAKKRILALYSGREQDERAILLNSLSDLINLSNAFASISDIEIEALGKKAGNELGISSIKEYLDIYLSMLERKDGNIPPVYLEIDGYSYESGRYSDPERMLIGQIRGLGHSCIKPNDAGEEAFNDVIKRSDDVILIRDKNGTLIDRALVFRRGNVVQIVTMNARASSLVVYKKIADQIMHSAILNNDNLDYIFINYWSLPSTERKKIEQDGFRRVNDSDFYTCFPHADCTADAVLLASKKEIQNPKDIVLDFEVQPKAKYKKVRQKVITNPTEDDITKIMALRIVLEKDAGLKEELSRNFEPCFLSEYQKIICGEDWYIGIRHDGSIEEACLPTNDPDMLAEMEFARQSLGIQANEMGGKQ